MPAGLISALGFERPQRSVHDTASAPRLQTAGAPGVVPAGWRADPVLDLHGRALEVVYDPTRHTVAWFMQPPAATTGQALARDGWERLAGDVRGELWVRDRTSDVRRGLRRPGRGLEPPRVA